MPFLGSLIAGVGSVVSTVAPIVGAYQSIASLTPRPTVTPQRISWMQPTPFYRRRYYTPSLFLQHSVPLPSPHRRFSVPTTDDFAMVSASSQGDRDFHGREGV